MKTDERTFGAITRTSAEYRGRGALVALAMLCLAGSSGCGGFFYALNTTAATSKIEKAQALGAEKYAPFEFYSAQEHLKKAMEEAAAADYGHAIHYADSAETYADKAIELSQKAHEGSGR